MRDEINIIYEDKDIVAIDKPPGLVVHFDGKTNEPSVTDWFLEKYPDARNVGEIQMIDGKKIMIPGVVHRIDRDTSGVLILAKNMETLGHLKNQFKERNIEKKYFCFLYGVPRYMKGTIDVSIGRSNKDFRLRSAEYGARGELREAATDYKVLEDNGEYSYVEAHPKTGRTHQLRVHFKALQHPIVCDPLYAPKRLFCA